jgi:hypothetical protein
MTVIANRFQATAYKLEEGSESVESTLLTYARVNGCSDEITMIDIVQEKEDIKAADTMFEQQALPMLDSLMGVCCSNFFFLITVGMCVYMKSNKKETGHVEQRDED